jgi:hypothetical protein
MVTIGFSIPVINSIGSRNLMSKAIRVPTLIIKCCLCVDFFKIMIYFETGAFRIEKVTPLALGKPGY